MGLTSEGLVEISAIDGQLAEGDRVVVGMDDSAASDAAAAAEAGSDEGSDGSPTRPTPAMAAEPSCPAPPWARR